MKKIALITIVIITLGILLLPMIDFSLVITILKQR